MEITILKKEKCPEHVIDHSKAVCDKAIKIASNFDNVDLDLVKKGALLHDLGRSKTMSIDHAIEGAKIAKKYGYCEEIINIIERHVGSGISEEESSKIGFPKKSYVPKTIEEKIVAHSDNLIHGTEEVDVSFVIQKWKKRIDNPNDNIERLINLHNELVEPFKNEKSR
ncbi:MAG: TIGR00295 family protein [Methanobrevibacter sp.]|jgi:uncharacterized protein|nr:TIGR00295 family protein [Methanobrevibacter sp.]